jgi:GTP diphosphokinase / guanosine-3',5'-bis(diphosphate) 3'-diphosphatase
MATGGELMGPPFIVHPLGVATLLYHADAPDHLIAAGAIHDLIEKTGVSPSELRERFGAGSPNLCSPWR